MTTPPAVLPSRLRSPRAPALARLCTLAVLLALAPAARGGGGLNLDFGTSYGAPVASYGAASGQTGAWNVVGLGVTPLVDLAGAGSGASVSVTAGNGGGNNASPPSSPDEFLLNDNLFSLTGATWSVGLSGLEPNNYHVLLYAPSNGAVSTGKLTVGGTEVASLPGSTGSTLIKGVSWIEVEVTVAGDTLSISGTDPGFSGLAGLQLVPSTPRGFNIDFGTTHGTPPANYAAASSQAGPWNELGLGKTLLTSSLGNQLLTSATVTAQSDTGWATITGATAAKLLLNDHFRILNGDTWSVEFAGLTAGDYALFFYAPTLSSLPTGNMLANGITVQGLQGSPMGFIAPGTSWRKALIVVTGTTLSITGSGLGASGLAGLQLVPESSAPSESYCTAGTSASGCTALITAVGTASASAASGFRLNTLTVEGGKNGLYFFGTSGRQANAWGNGTSFQCVVPPVKRTPLLFGIGSVGQCDGSFTKDLNKLWCPTCTQPAKNPGAGAVVQAQLWYRDTFNTSNQVTSLSNAVEFTLAP